MLFNSLNFLVFFPIVVLVYYLIPHKVRAFWLLIASYYFYMCWNPAYILLLLVSTVITYLSGILLEKVGIRGYDEKTGRRLKKMVLACSFVINLGILGYFKYFIFS